MAQDIINKNQDISYTNLDFSSIYTEVVNLAKQLSYKWDPSISDESDPGVVLLKLSALIADKMNYNIDKSILESFPLSVTQEGNARQLYEQLGYYMNWYESASVPVNITWIGEDKSDDIIYTIPKFTMITDSETSRTYALVGTIDGKNLVVSDGKLPKDGSTIQMIAMEGTPTTFSFLGETKITSQMIDENNRLYFETKYISQNCIFIRNSGNDQDNYLEWKRVDNLYEQPYNDLRYKLGIDSKSDVAYIEFPDNYAELIGSGIEIVYFIIDPEFTNIPAQALDRFLVNINPKEDTNLTLSLDNVKISNLIPATGHKNVESIDEAYANYKRTVGTFKTLITLRDYLNYILLEGNELCSNGFVTDRTNDPQLSYKIMSKVHGIDSLLTKVESDDKYIYADIDKFNSDETYYTLNTGSGEFEVATEYNSAKVYYTKETDDKLSPFSLKFYLLQDALAVNSKSTFNQTFDMLSSEDMSMVNVLIDEAAHIEHTYEDILPFGENTYKLTEDTVRDMNKSYYSYDEETNRYSFISNSYYALTFDTSIYPNRYYTIEEHLVTGTDFDPSVTYYTKNENKYIKENSPTTGNVYYTLTVSELTSYGFIPNTDYYNLDANEDYVKVHEQQPVVNVYYKYNPIYDIYTRINLEDIKSDVINPAENKWYNLIVLDQTIGVNPSQSNWYEIDIEAISPHIAYFRAKYPLQMTLTTYSVVGEGIQNDIKTNILNALYEALNSTKIDFGEKIELDYLTEIVLASDTRIKSVVFDNIEYEVEALYYDKYKNTFISRILPTTINLPTYSDEDSVITYNICKDIFAKSILAGVTTLLDKDTSFEYHLNQYYLYSNPVDNIYSITSETTIDMNNIVSAVNSDGNTTKNYTLKENEIITLVKPKLKNLQVFETGVHYEYLIYSDIEANNSYSLSKNEYIVFYTTILDSNKNITGYKCRIYTNGAIIKPSFKMNMQDSQSSMSDYFQTQLQPDIMTKSDYYYEYDTNSSYWVTSILNNSSIISNSITGNNDITIQTINRINILPEDGYRFYWNLNTEKRAETTGKRYYELFGSFDSVNEKNKNGDINSYTLKSGETLYYMDESSKNFAMLREGSTITRNCGINEEYTQINPENIYSFVPFDEENFIAVSNPSDPNQKSPALSGLYEYDEDDGYIPSEDTLFNNRKQYFVLVMNSMSDYYENNNGIYSPSGSITYNVFKKVSLGDMDLSSINPQENKYFEIVKYNGIEVEDYYNASNSESKSVYRPRFKHSDNSTVWSENILQAGFGDSFNSNDISTYPTSITINSGNSSLFSPIVNSLFEVDDTDLDVDDFYTFYDSESGGNLIDFSNIENRGKSPCHEGWYEVNDNNGRILSSKMFTYKPRKANLSSVSTPLSIINFDDVTQITSVLGYYYKFSVYDNTYIKTISKDPHISINASSNNVPSKLYEICRRIKIQNPLESISLTGVDAFWNNYLSASLPSSFYKLDFELSDENTPQSEQRYVFVNLTTFNTKTTSEIINNIGNNELYIGYLGSDEGVYFKEESPLSQLFGVSQSDPRYVKKSGDDTYKKLEDNDLDLWYSIVRSSGTSSSIPLSYVPLFIIPNFYKINYFVKSNFDNYYQLKTYVDKSFGTIAPWECDSLTSDEIINNPIESLSKVWKPLQDNCSITITENESYTLTEGDTISIIANYPSGSNELSIINWPIFSNTETVLNLNNYTVSYVHGGNEVTTLEKLSIPDSDWRGYSNLILNTSSKSGQILDSNHSLICYDSAGNSILTLPDAVENINNTRVSDIKFQLKYPVNNKVGSHISVVTYDELTNEIPNNIYVFNNILNNDNIMYSSDTHETTIKVSNGTKTKMPFKLPDGEYLLPITGPDYLKSGSYSVELYKFEENPGGLYYINKDGLFTLIDGDVGEVTHYALLNESNSYLKDFVTDSSDFSSNNTHYLYINNINSETATTESEGGAVDTVVHNYFYQLEFNFIASSVLIPEINLILGDIFKFSKNGLLTSSGTFDDIFDKIKSLDKENVFNYTFQPDINDLIVNPLNPKSFWDKNHIYNPFIIAQLDLNSADNIEYRFITSK